jgi:hypothetical protein
LAEPVSAEVCTKTFKQTEKQIDIQMVNKPFPNTLWFDKFLKNLKKTAGTEGE